jgi:hypothetical protein
VRVNRGAASAFAVASATALTLVVAAPNAMAAPSDCGIIFTTEGARNFVSSLCTSGTGQHRIHLTLQHFDPSVGRIPIVGEWANVGQYSTSGYPPHQIIDKWIELRN